MKRASLTIETEKGRIRAPIVVVLGHVDVGKTLLLDKIRGTAVAYREPGMITQWVGMSFIPWPAVEKFTGPLLDAFKLRGKVKIPGFLMIDTPGHEAFSNLRKRGGSVADIAILVIDILKGFEQQTYESLEILMARKVPFVVAANKLDRLPGWKSHPNTPFIFSVQKQGEDAIIRLEEHLAKIIMEFARFGINADRYDRVRDFSKTIPIVPTSALTGEGIADLLVVLAGIVQRFLMNRLYVHDKPGEGVILEIKEEKGLGTTADVVLYDGKIRRGDIIVTAGVDGPFHTRVRALLVPKPLDEMRDPEDRFYLMDEVTAAAGIKLLAPGLEKAFAGAPVYVVPSEDQLQKYLEAVREEVSEIRIETEKEGVVVKADTLGTLEALVMYLRSRGIPIRKADVGPITKNDVVQASIVKQKNPLYGVILAFNVKALPEVEEEAQKYGVRIFYDNILYNLVDKYLKWMEEAKRRSIEEELSKVIRPGKIRILPGYVFRRSNPAIVGVRVEGGIIKPGYPLVRPDGRQVGHIMQIQKHGKALQEARAGDEVAISIRGNVIVGRHIKEGDVLYNYIPEEHFYKLVLELKDYLSEDEREVLSEYAKLRKKWKEKKSGGA